ncbi:hypothetical protein NMG46_24460 [Mesorhizobium sp. LMG 17147]|uniref:hypothetical protein n=1 Tax=Mesorhizobium sp. LMG 17147 TaxID=2963091 RepID=UPI0020C993F7|nr:hypothetical protein [Mesorhizobium sp. LMG 17147]MCP9233349.1 hypothetical protein [Mesorhizobium sp. LMG 17147]
MDGIRLIADVLDRKPQGEAMIAKATVSRKLVADRLVDLKDKERVPVYMANRTFRPMAMASTRG